MSFVLPTFNEEETLETVIAEVTAAAKRNFTDYEIVIVDDGSTDRTAEIADRLAQADPNVRVVHHESNRGFTGAMASCIENATGEYVFLGPADGQGNFEDVARFWAVRDRYDLIFSHREHRGDHALRHAASQIWYQFIRLLFGTSLPELSSLHCFRRDAIPTFEVHVRPDASNFLLVMYLSGLRQGVRVGTVGIDHGPRRGGTAKGSSVRNALRTIAEDLRLCRQLRIKPRRR